MNRDRIYFNSSSKPTLGVEAELYTVSKETFNLCPGAPQILNHFKNDANVKEELLECIVEVNTNICNNILEVRSDLINKITEVQDIANENNNELVSIGTHPFARWKEQSVTNSNRYLDFLEKMQWPVRRLIISGLHVHVGIESGEKAISITNGMTRYIPQLIGLSANSPFFDSELTGLASTRTKIFEGLPTAGLPPLLKNYSEFQKFMRTLKRAGAIDSIREVWWDIRPHPSFGTVEIRVCDAVPTIEEMVNITAFIQCLVVGFSESYDEGRQLEILDPWVILENKWRATRFGLDAEIIIDESGALQPLSECILQTIDKLLPVADTLECRKELENLCDVVIMKKSPYLRQISAFNKHNQLTDILKHSISELKIHREVQHD